MGAAEALKARGTKISDRREYYKVIQISAVDFSWKHMPIWIKDSLWEFKFSPSRAL